MSALLLDTHILLWLDSGHPSLRMQTREWIEAQWRSGAGLIVSAVSAWEIALLAESGRITLDIPPDEWLHRFLSRPGIVAAPLGIPAATRAYVLDGFEHRDPADRLLIATAIVEGWTLVTYDARILAYSASHGRKIGLKAAITPDP